MRRRGTRVSAEFGARLEDLKVREHGDSGPPVLVLHGGPGAMGYMAPVGHGLAGRFRAIEPYQRRGGKTPLTVARHVADLSQVVESRCRDARPALVGHSWGAMLALAYAAAHPGRAAALVLVGCGTFDPVSRARMVAAREERIDSRMQERLSKLNEEYSDPDERMMAMGEALLPTYSYDLVAAGSQVEACDALGGEQSWEDMLRLQEAGVYPAAFAGIEAPVLMMHGALDPHPGRMILASLRPYLRKLEYHEWEHCGHYPWLERAVRDQFFDLLREWLARHSEDPGS